MAQDDHQGTASPRTLSRELVHRLRNDLGVAIATADLLMLEPSLGLQALKDVAKIRDACVKAIEQINNAA